MDNLEAGRKLLNDFDASKDKWNVPFPMGVFGTLRLGCNNQPLMGCHAQVTAEELKKDEYKWHRSWFREVSVRYESHHRAFLPDFSANGLSIHYSKGASCVFEIFTYKPEEWSKMIGHVDRLESFTPGHAKHDWGYWRTLAHLRVLPDDYDSPYFDGQPWYSDPRDLQIPVAEWEKYPTVPCWIYSSQRDNKLSLNAGNSPIIWYGAK